MKQEQELRKRLELLIYDFNDAADYVFKNKKIFDDLSAGLIDVSKIDDIRKLLAFVYVGKLNKDYVMLSLLTHQQVLSLIDRNVISEALINLSILEKRYEYNLAD